MKNCTLAAFTAAFLLVFTAGCRKNSAEQDLINASGIGDIQEIKRLLTLGANVNAEDTTLDHWTPLMWAVYSDQDLAVRVLLDAGADPNLRDATGKTALFYALHRQNQENIIKALILAGASAKEFLPEMQLLPSNYPSRVALEEALHLREQRSK